MDSLRIVLADDHPVVRTGLRALIDVQPGMDVVGEATDGPTAVAVAVEFAPDVLVLDVSMPGAGGAEVAERVKRERPGVKVVALSAHEDRGYVQRMLSAGACGYVLKRSAAEELVRAIRAAAAGETYLDPAVAGGVVGAADGAPASRGAVELSDREVEVVQLIARGYSNKEIAARLNLSVKTVETYKARSMEKLGIRTRVGLVQYAAERGWLTPQ